MATYSEVKSGLDEVASRIRDQRNVMLKVKSNAQVVSTALTSIANDYADLISTINAYGTSNASEAVAKADLAKLTTEFQALKTLADQVAAISV